MLIIFGMRHLKKPNTDVYSFGHLTLLLSLHYRVKCRNRRLTIDNNEFQVVHASAEKLLIKKRQTRLAIIITQKVTRVTSHHLHFSMCSKCPPVAQTPAVDVHTICQRHVQ